jgi:hypothetical protein
VDSGIWEAVIGAGLGAALTAIATYWVSIRLDRQRQNHLLIGAIGVVAAELVANRTRIERFVAAGKADEVRHKLTLGDWERTKGALAELEIRDPDLWNALVRAYDLIFEAQGSEDAIPVEDLGRFEQRLDDLRKRLADEQRRLRDELHSFIR